MMKTLLVHERTFARIASRLKGAAASLSIVTLDDAGQFRDGWSGALLEGPPDVTLAFGNADAFFSPSVRAFMIAILQSAGFDWFQSGAAGIENPGLAAIGRKARLYTSNHTQAEAMAEWALWQAFDFLRAGPGHRARQAQARWERVPAREMAGSGWLIVGYGAIGKAVGRRVRMLGGHVTGIRRAADGDAEGVRLARREDLAAELGRADIVLLCLPHTRQTEGIADAGFFGSMRPDSLFMNLGRGALVDEGALVSALDNGRPAFAALDVTVTEPLPPESPLWRHERISITAHDSSLTPGTEARTDETFLSNLNAYLAGERLANLVERAAFEQV